jgi:hypothetical protein
MLSILSITHLAVGVQEDEHIGRGILGSESTGADESKAIASAHERDARVQVGHVQLEVLGDG